MSAARNDEERALTSQQLDAFHATFNFCMTCRQYTCGNCWNQAEGRCLTCAPHLGHEILPAPFPDQAGFEPTRIDAEAWPDVDRSVPGEPAAAADGRVPALDVSADDAWGDVGAAEPELPDFDAVARLAFLSGDAPAPASVPEMAAAEPEPESRAEPDIATAPETEPLPEAAIASAGPAAAIQPATTATEPEPAAQPDAVAAAAPGTQPEMVAVAPAEPETQPEIVAAAAPEALPEAALASPEPAQPSQADGGVPSNPDERAAALAARTSDLLRRFRPGQNIDAELAAFEAELAASTTAEPSAAAEAVAEPETLAAAAEALAEPETVAPLAAEPEPIAAAAELVEPAPQPIAAESPAAAAPAAEPSPAPPAPVREDRIEQPTWRIYAPDQRPGPGAPEGRPEVPAPPGPAPIAASAEPQWPTRPDIPESPAMTLLANRANRSASDALWAASAQEVLAPPPAAAGAPTTGVQPCSNCGLSLSATARFCRRCGTRQG